MISIKIGIFAKIFYEKSHPGEFDPLNGLVLVDAVDFTSRDWKSDVLVVMVVDLAANAFWQFQVSWHAVDVDHPLVQSQVLVIEDFLELGFQLDVEPVSLSCEF